MNENRVVRECRQTNATATAGKNPPRDGQNEVKGTCHECKADANVSNFFGDGVMLCARCVQKIINACIARV